MQDIFVDYQGEWAVVDAGVSKYIGRVVSEDEKELILQPVLDYISGLEQDEEGNISRRVMITPSDLCLGFDSKLNVRQNSVMSVMYMSEMATEDRREYEKNIHRGVAISLNSRAAKSGIKLASNIPPQSDLSSLILK